jgi:hypothetical protein
MDAKISEDRIKQIMQVMRQQAAVNAYQVIGPDCSTKRIMLGAICASRYVSTVVALVFAAAPSLLL